MNKLDRIDLRALNMDERIKLINEGIAIPGSQIDAEWLAARIARWKDKPAFRNDEIHFKNRLDYAGITTENFSAVAQNQMAYNRSDAGSNIVNYISTITQWLAEGEAYGDLNVISSNSALLWPGLEVPLALYAKRRLDRESASITGAPERFQGRLSQIFETILLSRLQFSIGPVVALEERIHAIEQDSAKDPGRFTDDCVEVNEVIQCIVRYPCLCRTIVVLINYWVEACVELVNRIVSDWGIIEQLLPREERQRKVTSVQSAGDYHNQGRFVAIISFTDGATVLYKPRDLVLEKNLGTLISWIGVQSNIHYRYPKTLPCGPYGWQEFIANTPCESEHEFGLYYTRLGGLLAFFRVFSGSDLHYENIIAHGSNPVIIDAEACLRPTWKRSSGGSIAELLPVTSMNILPHKIQITGHEIFDSSAFAAQSGKRVLELDSRQGSQKREPIAMRVPSQVYTSTIRSNPSIYEKEFINGFELIYRLLWEKRSESSFQHLVQDIEGIQRIVLRPTISYVDQIISCMHPDVLQDAFEIDLVLENMWPRRSHSQQFTFSIIQSEHRQLWNLDVPVFHAHINDRNLMSGGQILVHDFFSSSAREVVYANLARLGDADLQLQIWAIQASIGASDECRLPSVAGGSHIATPFAKRLSLVLARIANTVHESRVISDANESVSWLQYTSDSEQRLVFALEDTNFYEGMAGVGLFLGAYRVITGDESYLETEAKVHNQVYGVIRSVDRAINPSRSFGVFSGIGGHLLSLRCLKLIGALKKWPYLDAGIEGFARTIYTDAVERVSSSALLPTEMHDYDVMFGASGGALQMLMEDDGDLEIVEHLKTVGRYLLAICDVFEKRPLESVLSGFSHGIGGVAYALFKLFVRFGDKIYLDAMYRALACEDRSYDSNQKNWLDLREMSRLTHASSHERKYSVAWCHGATGIGWYRLAIYKHLRDKTILKTVEAAASTTFANWDGRNAGLCHGVFGRLAFLKRLEQVWTDGRVTPRIPLLTEESLRRLERKFDQPYARCTFYGKMGFMNGISGVGYELCQWESQFCLPDVMLVSK